jgi:hypothetical protein
LENGAGNDGEIVGGDGKLLEKEIDLQKSNYDEMEVDSFLIQ